MRTVLEGAGYKRDPLGGASYRLDGSTLTVDYWGLTGTLATTADVDHGSRFASQSFSFTPGHACPGPTGSLMLSNSSDRFTITMPHDAGFTTLTMSGSGHAGFIGPATNNGATIDYEFSFETLAPDEDNDYEVVVEATWDDNPNPDAFCGGTLAFRLVKRHFSLD